MRGNIRSDLPIVSRIGNSLGKLSLFFSSSLRYESCSEGVISCLIAIVDGLGTGTDFGNGGSGMVIFLIVVLDDFVELECF